MKPPSTRHPGTRVRLPRDQASRLCDAMCRFGTQNFSHEAMRSGLGPKNRCRKKGKFPGLAEIPPRPEFCLNMQQFRQCA